MHPQDVDSPKDRLSELNIVRTAAEGWFVAMCMWLEQDGTKKGRHVGIRWNGCENELGNPRSTGHGTWFLLSENLIAEFVERHASRRESGEIL